MRWWRWWRMVRRSFMVARRWWRRTMVALARRQGFHHSWWRWRRMGHKGFTTVALAQFCNHVSPIKLRKHFVDMDDFRPMVPVWRWCFMSHWPWSGVSMVPWWRETCRQHGCQHKNQHKRKNGA